MRSGAGSARKWTKTGVWAIADRGFFSLSNFLVSLLLARWLPDTSYGAFAMALAVFLLAGGLHEGWITEPLIVFGSARYRDRFADYLGFLLRRHLLFSLWTTAAILAIAGASAGIGRTEVATALVAAGLAAPLILLQWLGRLACYASVGPRRAALAGGVQLALVLAGFVALQKAGVLTTEAAFGLLGLAGGLTGGALVLSLRPRLGKKADLTVETRDLHRKYGGWAVATGLLTWIPGQVYYLVLPAAGAVAAAGNLRALMNLVLPLMQAFVALSMVLTAGLARVRHTAAFGRIVRSALSVLVLIAIGYGLLLGWVGPRLMHWLYSGRYDHLAGLLALVGWLPLLGVGATVLAPALRALERPDQVFVAYAASTAVSLSAGLYLTVEYGVTGAAVGLLLTTAVTTSVLGWKLIASLRSGPLPQGAGAVPGAGAPASSATTARSPSEKTT